MGDELEGGADEADEEEAAQQELHVGAAAVDHRRRHRPLLALDPLLNPLHHPRSGEIKL